MDFATGGATTASGAWQANKPSTIQRKGHSQILFGQPGGGYQLFKSITNKKHTDHVFNWVKGGSTLEIGTKHWKARIHQLGLGKHGVIRRPIDPTHAQRDQYVGILFRWVMEGTLS